MTLVAAYRSFGIPMLIGDLLITDNTAPHLDASGSHEHITKKIELLGKSLAIGWTGSLFVAKSILRDMRQKLPIDGVVDRTWLENYLASYGAEDFGEYSVYLVGWLIADENYCFSWNSSYPEQVFYGEPMIGGSGQDTFTKIADGWDVFATEIQPTPFDTSAVTNIDLAIWMSLSCVTDMMSHVWLADTFYSLGVGPSYEIICLFDGSFHYIDDLLHLCITVYFDENAVVRRVELGNIMYKCFICHDHAVILTIDNSTTTGRASIAPPLGIVNPNISEQVSDMIPSIIYTQNCNYPYSGYSCCSIIAKSPDYNGNLPPTIIPNNAPNTYPFLVKISNMEIKLDVSADDLTRKYHEFRLSLHNSGTYKNLLPLQSET